MSSTKAIIIASLEAVRRRPTYYVNPLTPQHVESFLAGYRECLFALGHSELHQDYMKSQSVVVHQRGWKLLAGSLIPQLIAKGMTPETIIQELLTMEILIWQNTLTAGKKYGTLH